MKPFENETELAARCARSGPRRDRSSPPSSTRRAAAGFPRDSRWASAVATVRERLASTPPRRLIAPAGAFAVAAVVIATAVVATTRTEARRLPAARPRRRSTPGARVAARQRSSRARSPNRPPRPPHRQAQRAGATRRAPPGRNCRPAASGPYAANAGRRDIERSAEIVLGADPAEVRADAAKVFDAVHAADGIVLSSSIRDGEAGDAGADFELLIPSAKLGDALASISRIGEVRSRHEATQDITAPTVSVGEKLRDSRATIEGLLGQLAGADTDEERAAVEAQLRSERYRAAALRSRLSSLNRRANLSRVTLRIETGASTSSSDAAAAAAGVRRRSRRRRPHPRRRRRGDRDRSRDPRFPFAAIALIAWLSRRAWIRARPPQRLARRFSEESRERSAAAR